MGFIARAFALLLGGLAVANAQNTCTDYDGIGRDTCVAQGNSCEWCGTFWGGTKCSNSGWSGPCSSGWKSTPAPAPPPPPPTCSSYTSDTTPGSFTDGSGSSEYGDSKDCAWKLECPSGQNVQQIGRASCRERV